MVAQLVWFKRDLRTADHRPLFAAAQAGPVLPFYIDEPQLWRQPDADMRHRRFVADALASLENGLAALGLSLCIIHGPAEEVLTACLDRFGDFTLWSHEETGNAWSFARDRRVAGWCTSRGIVWHEFPQNGVRRGLRKRDGWAAQWERRMREPLLSPPARVVGALEFESTGLESFRRRDIAWSHTVGASLPAFRRTQQPGSRDAALALLDGFLSVRGEEYSRNLSSPLSGVSGCSRLSPHLAFGTISLREVVQATRSRRDALDPALPASKMRRRSLTAFLSRLHWHCHFIQKLETQPSIEFVNMHRAYDGLRESQFDDARFDAWCRGTTGLPFVDACMRALIAGGWMNFRMRAMLCSFASYHLWLHWRKPALHLARLFTDYEPGIHYSQMQMQSGTTGINTVRMYNPVKQGYDQDPRGVFVRRWCPELARLPDDLIHEPWIADSARLATFGVRLGDTYPAPIVDHLEAARHARDAVWAVRRLPQFAPAADAIQQTHGSRRSGLAHPDDRRRTAGRRTPPQNALELPFDSP